MTHNALYENSKGAGMKCVIPNNDKHLPAFFFFFCKYAALNFMLAKSLVTDRSLILEPYWPSSVNKVSAVPL